ncbi:Endothelin-converting enzyme 1 [Cichlidogyrus casuarinus]|uniref:Endothelin-converting enzyme 1 n=1 Tax=Cichlidogyrus casuarinus TaxID=1844966 RepID=A0ABD2QM39_9PLAT
MEEQEPRAILSGRVEKTSEENPGSFTYTVFSEGIVKRPEEVVQPGGVKRFEAALANFKSSAREVGIMSRIAALFTEQCFIGLMIVLLIMILLLLTSFVNLAQSSVRYSGLCNTAPCVVNAGDQKQFLNQTVNPCHNFYQYVCGRVEGQLPPGMKPKKDAEQGSVHTLTEVLNLNQDDYFVERYAINHLNEQNLQAVYERVKSVGSTYIASSAISKLENYLYFCSHATMRKHKGAEDLLLNFNAFNGIWMFDQTQKNLSRSGTIDWPKKPYYGWYWSVNAPVMKNASLNWLLGEYATKYKISPLFTPRVVYKNGYKLLLSPNTIFNLHDSDRNFKSKLQIFATWTFQLMAQDAGYPTNTEMNARIRQAVKDAMDVYDLFTKGVGHDSAIVKTTVDEFKRTAPELKIDFHLKKLFTQLDAKVDGNYEFYVKSVSHFRQLSESLKTLSQNNAQNRMLNNFLLLLTFHHYGHVLGTQFRFAHDYLFQYLHEDLEMACLQSAYSVFSPVLGAMYMEHHVSDQTATKARKIGKYLKQHLLQDVKNNFGLMHSKVVESLTEKIDQMVIITGVPFKVESADLSSMYRCISDIGYDIFSNELALASCFTEWKQDLLLEQATPIVRMAPLISLQLQSNVIVNTRLKYVVIPYGMLQPMIYHEGTVDSSNFGSLGQILSLRLVEMLLQKRGFNSVLVQPFRHGGKLSK